VDVLPAPIVQVQTLICGQGGGREDQGEVSTPASCLQALGQGLGSGLTVVHLIAQLLDGGQVSTDAVEPVNVQPWGEREILTLGGG
jgi:hypothetical protein